MDPDAELDKLAPEQLGVAGDDPLVGELIDRMLDVLLDFDGPLAMLSGDLVVEVESFTRESCSLTDSRTTSGIPRRS